MATRTNKDEFTPATKNKLAMLAAYFCSNPRCLKLTAGPNRNLDLPLRTGHAAHIHAASKLGPRFVDQPSENRRDISNGLWLCRECGVEVDDKRSKYTAEELRYWRDNHIAMIAEVRTEGYSKSLELLRASRKEPEIAKRALAMLEDRRALWQSFDAEFPDRVRISLDFLRAKLTELRSDLPYGTQGKHPLDAILLAMIQTIHRFFDEVGATNLRTLECNSGDPEWQKFELLLAELRKSIGLQIADLADTYGFKVESELTAIMPKR